MLDQKTPVSYTHLDVYKRQLYSIAAGLDACVGYVLTNCLVMESLWKHSSPCLLYTSQQALQPPGRVQKRRRGAVQRAESGLRHSPCPVSYTHLDVYKRQG